MFTRYAPLLLGLLLLGSSQSGLAQHRPTYPARFLDRAALHRQAPVRFVPPSRDAPAAQRAATPTLPSSPAAVPQQASWGTIMGYTTYDLQTNRSTANRMALTGANLSAVWTLSCQLSSAPNFNNRGIGYNLSTSTGSTFTNGSGGNCPSTFGIGNRRTGWPEIVHSNGQEVVFAHTGTGIVKVSRPIGAGSWTTSAQLPFSVDIDGVGSGANATWPRAVASGNTIHLIYCDNITGNTNQPQMPSGVVNPVLYNRSLDGGVTWDRTNINLPQFTSANFKSVGGDSYAVAANGQTVAVTAGSFGDNTLIAKSTDNGTTFTTTRIAGPWTAADTLMPTRAGSDTARVIASDGSISMIVDNTGTVHWFSGSQLVQVARNASTGFYEPIGFYNADVFKGLLYWNDRELRLSKPVVIAGIEDFVPGNATFSGLAQPTDANGGVQPYSVIGPVSMPTASVNTTTGEVYCIYAAGVQGTSNTSDVDGQYYRDLYVLKLGFPGSSQVQVYLPKNISRDLRSVPDGAAATSEESVFPSAIHQIVGDKLHYQWMSDFEPGNSSNPTAPGPDPEVESAIMYDAITVSAITWKPDFLVNDPCALAAPTVVANTPACGETLSLSATGVPVGATYQWSGPNGFASTLAAPQITNVGSAATGTYLLTITSGSCSSNGSKVVTVTTPSAAFSYAAASYCKTGANPAPTLTGAPGGTFSATPAGLSLNAASGLITLSASNTGTYTITYALSGNCATSRSQVVTITAGSQGTFSYPAGVRCTGSAGSVTPTLASGSTAGTFSATPTGLSFNAATGVVNLAASQPGAYTITNTIAAAGACPAVSSSASLTLSAPPTATISANGPTSLCPGGTIVLTASGGTAYAWSTGATTASITVGTAGSYTVTVANAGGCTATATTTVMMSAPAAPTASGAGRCSPGVVTLTAAGTPTGGSYRWYTAASGGTPISGATAATYSPAVFSTTTYYVSALTAGGCESATRAAAIATINAVPATPTIAAGGPTTFCQGGSVTLTASAAPAGGTYLWNTGATTPSITVSTAGSYAVIESNGSCASAISTPTTVTVNPLPAAPTPAATPATVALGQSTTLTVTNPQTGVTYTWTGPGLPTGGTTGTSLTATPTSAGTASYQVVARTSAGCQLSATQAIAVTTAGALPTITALSPTAVVGQRIGANVVITGTNLTGATSVSFNGTPATPLSGGTATSLTVVVPVGATSGPLTVTSPAGTSAPTAAYTILPYITTFTPTSGPVGTVVTINGTSLTGATVVKFNATNAASYTVNSDVKITAVIAAGTTTGKVTVTTPSGTRVTGGSFTVTASPVPAITSFSPASGTAGTSVTLTGTGFTAASAVKFNGTAATSFTVVSSTSITTTVPAGATTGAISVTTPGGTATSSTAFTVMGSGPLPTITSFTPAAGTYEGQVVTITGTNLTGATVRFNGTLATVTTNTATSISTKVPVGATSGNLTATTSAGTATAPMPFNVSPYVVDFQPRSGPAGTTVVITGTGLSGATVVKVGTLNAASYTVNSATQITAVVAAGSATGKVTVITVGGMRVTGATYTVTTARPGLLARAGELAPADVAVYPSPAHDWVWVSGLPSGEVIELLDAAGRVIRKAVVAAVSPSTALDVQGLPTGMYSVRAGTAVRRIMVAPE